MEKFEKAQWIWYSSDAESDSYCEFKDTFISDGAPCEIRISCDSDYTLFVNGSYASSGQYGDFEHYKIYDTVDITEFICKGENTLEILVHYFGEDTLRYRKGVAGLIFEVESNFGIVLSSSESTLARKSPTYVSGNKRIVTDQLGFSFTYDATKENDDVKFLNAVLVDKRCDLFPRPIKKHDVKPRANMKSVRAIGENRLLVDLGGETVGLPVLEFNTAKAQKITVAWGEHVKDGGVRMLIGRRRFYYEYMAKEGYNNFTNYMLRLGCRYIEVISEEPIELIYAGVLPQVYDIAERQTRVESDLDRRIYDASVNTLRKCMMEHYVDCPWREQCLYAFDSRNQMLCGYYAFENGNADYARSSLKLLGKDRRGDGLLSICSPCGVSLAIPSFSLYYIMEMKEYIVYTGDLSLAKEMLLKMKGILDEFLMRYKDGQIYTFEGASMWNFYDWSPYASGTLGKAQSVETDIFINALFLISLKNYEFICQKLGAEFPYAPEIKEAVSKKIKESFYDECGMFSARENAQEYTMLGNSLAILAGVITDDEAQALCDKMISEDSGIVDCSLSMKVFQYEALLSVNTERYKDFVLSEIRANYKKMLDSGSDTFWETIKGEEDFANAGSLCHGWSAIPIYFFHRLGIAE